MELLQRISWLKKTIQENLFPHLRECLDDPLTEKQKDLIMILEVLEIENYVHHLNDSWTGRPPEDRCALARSFVAKAVYDLANTRMLIDLLHTMPSLRKICGFVRQNDIPPESTFSRAFAEFALSGLGNTVHTALVDTHLSDERIGHKEMRNLSKKRRRTKLRRNGEDRKRERYGNRKKKRG